jgi:hypothetical protein
MTAMTRMAVWRRQTNTISVVLDDGNCVVLLARDGAPIATVTNVDDLVAALTEAAAEQKHRDDGPLLLCNACAWFGADESAAGQHELTHHDGAQTCWWSDQMPRTEGEQCPPPDS